MISCEAYSLVSSGPSVTHTHLSGIMEVLRSTTHQAATAKIQVFLFRKFRHLSLMQSLVSRRALAGEHIWWLCSAVQAPSPVEDLMQLAVQLPALIETAKIVRHSCDPDERVVQGIRTRLSQLEFDLAGWLQAFESTIEESTAPSSDTNEVPLDSPVFSLRSRPVVPVPAVQFRSFLDATCHAFYWICLLLLQEAVSGLPEPAFVPGLPTRDLIADIDCNADNLCASIPYLARTAGGSLSKGVSVIAPLHFASEWFQQNGNDLKLQWCRESEQEWREQLPFLQW